MRVGMLLPTVLLIPDPVPRAPQPCCKRKPSGGPPSITSRYFTPLSTPAEFNEAIATASSDCISVVKYQAPWCRTCRATSPLLDRALDRVAERLPNRTGNVRLYSLELVRNGKAAGERMNNFFKSRNITEMPYVELYMGRELIDSEVIPPTRLERFQQMLGQIQERCSEQASAALRRQRALVLQLLRQRRDAERPQGKSGGTKSAGHGTGGRSQTRAPGDSWRPLYKRADGRSAFSNRAIAPRRGAPLRGTTGGRRKGARPS